MTDNQPPLNMRWFIPTMMIALSGFLFLKGPANNNAQLLFRIGTLVVGVILLVVLNLPNRGSGSGE